MAVQLIFVIQDWLYCGGGGGGGLNYKFVSGRGEYLSQLGVSEKGG
jgi:hypothetical protein